MNGGSTEWQTPDWLFNELNEEFNFGIDLCCTKENTKCDVYCMDYLNIRITQLLSIELLGRDTCFMNPPYSNPKPFIEKAWEDSKYCKIVCLVKCDPSTRWWATFWEYGVKRVCYNTMKFGYIETSCKNGWITEPGACCEQQVHKCPVCDEGYYKYNGPKPGCEVRFFPKRIKFDPPKGWEGQASSPSFPSALLIFDRRGVNI